MPRISKDGPRRSASRRDSDRGCVGLDPQPLVRIRKLGSQRFDRDHGSRGTVLDAPRARQLPAIVPHRLAREGRGVPTPARRSSRPRRRSRTGARARSATRRAAAAAGASTRGGSSGSTLARERRCARAEDRGVGQARTRARARGLDRSHEARPTPARIASSSGHPRSAGRIDVAYSITAGRCRPPNGPCANAASSAQLAVLSREVEPREGVAIRTTTIASPAPRAETPPRVGSDPRVTVAGRVRDREDREKRRARAVATPSPIHSPERGGVDEGDRGPARRAPRGSRARRTA